MRIRQELRRIVDIRAARGLDGHARGAACAVALRPEAARLESAGSPAAAGRNRLEGTIEAVSFLGSVVRIKVRIGGDLLSLDTFNNPGVTPPERGTPATVTFSPADVLLLQGQ